MKQLFFAFILIFGLIQRVGVKIQIYPTVKGIADGKDNLLEKAIVVLENGW
jgi:hypothetical protein